MLRPLPQCVELTFSSYLQSCMEQTDGSAKLRYLWFSRKSLQFMVRDSVSLPPATWLSATRFPVSNHVKQEPRCLVCRVSCVEFHGQPVTVNFTIPEFEMCPLCLSSLSWFDIPANMSNETMWCHVACVTRVVIFDTDLLLEIISCFNFQRDVLKLGFPIIW